MPDRIQNLLRKLPAKQRREIERIITLIIQGDVAALDVKKLKGADGVYRVRKGDFRIIYKTGLEDAHIIAIERRSDTTYREF